MRVVVQRVTSASVDIDGTRVGEIAAGLLLLVGFGSGDNETKLPEMAKRVVNLRIFADDKGRFNRSLADTSGGILAVPQFTLYADTTKGRRPYFGGALAPELASPLFDGFIEQLGINGCLKIETGKFGAMMKVNLQNDGPVTIILES